MSMELQMEAQRKLEMSHRKLAFAEEFRQQRLENLVEKLKEHVRPFSFNFNVRTHFNFLLFVFYF